MMTISKYGLTFQSTLPSQGATWRFKDVNHIMVISIHAPLTGSDGLAVPDHTDSHNFNPRSPHRERRQMQVFNDRKEHFNPRSPHRERPMWQTRTHSMQYFNPRSPHRERRFCAGLWKSCHRFQSTLPSQGATTQRS